ncbi:MAG: aldehyde ferredoxin oxidoreductase family protein [Theionarchaea archaeon]|nr:MAG: hypothetical protein AYK18_12340 [Theionarchaea archaeon DG-70]MBU7010552.1 aldehyde ferredoxin oxidoreductase family protein [Theionarchaea archaeon]
MKVVHINLHSQDVKVQDIDEQVVRMYLGGRGLGAYFLNQLLPSPQSVDPFDPENPFIITPGLLSGTPVPSASRCTFTAKSPLTGAYGYSTVGGHLGSELRMAGIASLVITGRASHPVYVSITDEEVLLNNAQHLWGKDTWETEDTIKEELGDVQMCSIGKGGENRVRFASIIHDRSRAAGRCGMGAVMGSKHLKAVAVRGEQGIPIADVKLLKETFFQVTDALQSNWYYPIFSTYGSPSGMLASKVMGLLPTKHYQEGGSFDEIDAITGETLYDTFVTRNLSCSSCTVHCDRVFSVNGENGGEVGSGCEHYHMCNLGTNLLITDLESILRIVNQLNKLGIDVGDTCETISWLIECGEQGLITAEEVGVPVSWGDAQAVEAIAELIARREGIGAVLAEGSERASEHVGQESTAYLTTVKGMSVPANDPRGDPVWGLGFAVGVRGADHLSFMSVIHRIQDKALARKIYGDGSFAEYRKTDRKGFLVKQDEDAMAVIDSLGICKWNYTALTYTYTLEYMAQFATAVTGFPFDEKALLEIGERIYHTEKVFNMKMGMNRSHDTLPHRFVSEPLKTGLMKGNVVPLESMLDDYYKARKWDVKTGLPSKERLQSLGIDIEEV